MTETENIYAADEPGCVSVSVDYRLAPRPRTGARCVTATPL
ncbi:hypothetical protein AB0I68_35860 [Streptomyces sp. NPDC050448]